MGTRGWEACNSTYTKPPRSSTPMIKMKYTYGVLHETIGAWLKAKLNSTRPDTPRKTPAPSTRFHRLTPASLVVFSPAGGKTSTETPASPAHTAAMVQNAHGHETS